MVQSLLPRPASDHNPIMLDGSGVRRGLTPFRFVNMWLKVNGFKELLSGNWGEMQMSGSASIKLVEKLKTLKMLLKKWNKDEFGNVYDRKASTLNAMNSCDSLETSRPLSQEEQNARLVAKEEYKKLVLLEEISKRQKSREIWLRGGDRNTGFFSIKWLTLIGGEILFLG